MSYITEQELFRRHSLPVAIPAVEIQRGDWLVLSTIKVVAGVTFNYRLLQLQLIEIKQGDVTTTTPPTPCDTPTPNLINKNLGWAYVAIFKNFQSSASPATLTYTGTSVDIVTISTIGVAMRDTTKDSLVITDPGEYSFVLVNNCQDADIRASVDGQTTLDVA